MTYLNTDNITVSLGPSMSAEPFENVSTANSLANVIDASSPEAEETHSQTSHVWFFGEELVLEFDFGQEYDLTELHFWNYHTETFDVDLIEFSFLDADATVVDTLEFTPELGVGVVQRAEDFALALPGAVQHVVATLSGTNGHVDFNNIGFTGTAKSQSGVIEVGGAGFDDISGGPGNDQIWAGPDDESGDSFSGNAGNDIIGGGPGNDTIQGNTGDDTIFGGSGADAIEAGLGDDLVWPGDGNDTIDGGDGDNILGGGFGDDIITSGTGADTIFGGRGSGADDVSSGAGNDRIFTGAGDDTIEGGADGDVLFNGDGQDIVDGGAGDDTLWGGPGDDTLTGGDGADTFSFVPGNASDTITDFNSGVDQVVFEGTGLGFLDLTFIDTVDGVEVSYGTSSLVLTGLASTDLDAGDFIFV